MDYKGEIDAAVSRLKAAVSIYEDLHHPCLIRLIDHYSVGCGYVAIFDWVNGEGLFSYWDYAGQAMSEHPASPNYRFRHLQIKKRIESVDRIMEFHQHVIERGYVPIDFYDGSLLYDFDADKIYICDIDFYRKMPAVNDMGKMWGSSRFMAPEEYEMGAPLDEVKTVYNMGTTMFEMLCITGKDTYNVNRSFETWSASRALYDIASIAVSAERGERHQTIAELLDAWNTAKKTVDIQYRQLSTGYITLDMLNQFNRYQKVEKSWRKKNGEWVLVDNPYVEEWDEVKKQKLATDDFSQIINSGGVLFCAYDGDKLIGFSGIDGNFIGSRNQYLWLVYLHVSYEYRGKGIGRKLFLLTANAAKRLAARKLYISANSSKESQAFYRSIGCVDTEEVIPALFEAEPYDVHMEYVL